ncbi:MAG TPA: discoidin domain-containing protein [Prolixibacteraceae bacterium]|nr:discoidin domain-containing protein [Prolixibacteraceae bacterium]
MKNITYIILWSLIVLIINSCQQDELAVPNSVSSISSTARVGAVVIKWVLPADTNMRYIQVRYIKNGRVIKTNASTFTDSCLITGLLNKIDYTFEVQSFNKNDVGGAILSAGPVTPIRRAIEISYTYAEIPLIYSMLTTYTQESSEGPKTNLIDGNISTYWHTAWSSGTAPLPHWIQINFNSEILFGGFKYWMRQGSSTGGRPNQWDVQSSADGITWTTQWASLPALAVDPVTAEFQQMVDTPISSKFIKVRILATPENTTYTHLGEFKALAAIPVVLDRELEAEQNYN